MWAVPKESDGRNSWRRGRVECAEVMKSRSSYRDVCLSFVSVRVCGSERETYVEKNGLVSRSIEEWEEGLLS